MKKIVSTSLLIFTAFLVYAQPQIGLIVGPSVSMSRVKHKTDATGDVMNDGAALKFKFGLEADFMISDTYAFSTGVIFAPKRAGYTIKSANGAESKEDYKVHYIQLPVTLKLFTSEIQPDIKAFFQLGFKGEVKIFDEPFNENYEFIEDFRLFDCSFTGGIGVEYGAGVNTVLYGGIFYDRGLVDIVKSSKAANPLETKLDMLDIKFGLKF